MNIGVGRRQPRSLRAHLRGRSVVLGMTLGGLIGIGGCAVGPNFHSPSAPKADRYTVAEQPTETPVADNLSQRFIGVPSVDGRWWQQFGSPQIDGIVQEVLNGNPSLAAAQASLRQSQAQLRAGYGIFYPSVSGQAGASRQVSTPQKSGLGAEVGSGAVSSIFNLFTASASISYALDLFGGERRTVEALSAQSDYQRYELQATSLTLTANAVNTLIARSAYADQIDSTEVVIKELREQVRLAQIHSDAGTGPYSDVLAFQSQLAGFEATLPPLRQKLDQSEDLLATLVGRPPSRWQPPPTRLDDLKLPTDIPVLLPSSLTRQRPDILAAEAQLHAACAEVGVATAELLPSITLDASYGANSNTASSLFNSSSGFWGLGANLTAPLFEGGTLWFQRKAAIERFKLAQANYQQTVLSAFGQVADSLHGLQHDAEALAALSRQTQSAADSLRLTQANYQSGLADGSQVLLADSQLQQARINYLQAKAARLQDTVALYAALGGGWGDSPQASAGGQQ